MPVPTSAHNSTDDAGCLAALCTRVWWSRCKSEECIVRPRAPCRQSLFERPAGGLLQVPERQKKNRQFGGFRLPRIPAAQPLTPPPRWTPVKGGPEKGVQNHWFWRVFAYFCRAAKVGPGSGGGQPTGFREEITPLPRKAGKKLLTNNNLSAIVYIKLLFCNNQKEATPWINEPSPEERRQRS